MCRTILLLILTLFSVNCVAQDYDRPPQFPGGEDEMYRFLANKIGIPLYCSERNINGRVIVKFVVRDDGLLDSISVLQSAFPLLDNEVIRVVSAIPRFEPAMKDGLPVRATFELPVTFKIEGGGSFMGNSRKAVDKYAKEGVKWSRKKEFSLAEKSFKDALRIAPYRFDIINYCDSILEGTERQYGFRKWVSKLLQDEVELFPETAPLYIPLVTKFREEALKQKPDDINMQFGLQRAKLLGKEYQQAIEIGDSLLSNFSPEEDEYLYSRILATQIKAKLYMCDFQGVVDLFGGEGKTLFLKYKSSKLPFNTFGEYFDKKSEQVKYEPVYDLIEAYIQLGREEDAREMIEFLKYYLKGSFKQNTLKMWKGKPYMLSLAGLDK